MFRDFGISLDLHINTDASAAKGIAMRIGLGKVRHLAVAGHLQAVLGPVRLYSLPDALSQDIFQAAGDRGAARPNCLKLCLGAGEDFNTQNPTAKNRVADN